MLTRPVPGAKVTSHARELAHGAFGKGGFAIDQRQNCQTELLGPQGEPVHAGRLELAIASSGRRNIVSVSQLIDQ